MPKGDALRGKPRAAKAGRPPGVPNKLNAELREILQADIKVLSVDMLALALNPETKPEHRIKIWEIALKKTLPDLTATTLNPDQDGKAAPLQIVINPPARDHEGD